MRVGIDAHVLGTGAGGNETYVRALLLALGEHGGGIEVTTFVNREFRENGGEAFGFPMHPLPVRSSYLRVPLALPWAARRATVDVLHVQYTAPPIAPCPYVVSMHDIVALRHPESMPFLDRHRLRLLTPGTLRRAARIFVLTNALRDEIADAYRIPLDRFDVVRPAPDPIFHPISDAADLQRARAKYSLPERYILYVGLLQPRKNLDRLAEAFAALAGQGLDHTLVVVGKRAWLYREMLERIEALALGARIAFTGPVAREDLPALYSAADAFAYVSLYEGFGIPALEALACGCPVLTSKDAALCEVTGSAAVHVEARDVGEIGDGLLRILSDEALRARLRKEGLAQAGAFTAEAMAKAAIAGYRKAIGD